MSNQLAAVAGATELSRSAEWTRAVVAWEVVVRANPVNGTYQDRLARARFAAGDYSGALAAYRQALALGAWSRTLDDDPESVLPGEIAYLIARCLARLGDHDEALTALAEAMRLGLRDPDRALTDEHLSPLRDDRRLVDLVGMIDPSGLSRVDGWRADIELVRREVSRRVPMPHMIEPGFEDAVAALIDKVPDLEDIQIVVEMWRLLRMLGDGHAFVDVEPVYPQWRHALPVWLFRFAEGLFVVAADPRYADLLGAEVLAFDGHPVPEVLVAIDPFLTQDNEYGPTAAAPYWLRQPAFLHAVGVATERDRVTLTVRRRGAAVAEVGIPAEAAAITRIGKRDATPGAVHLHQTLAGPGPAYLRHLDTHYWFEHLAEAGLVYFQFNGIGDHDEEPLAAFYERMFAFIADHEVSRLAIDLRWNTGGDTFLALPLVHRVIGEQRINRPGKLFVIIGRHTFSAAQNTATLLERHTNAIFVGEPTGSRPNFTGETVPFTLPYSRLLLNFSDLYWQTSWPFDRRTAIAPEIYAPPTFAAYRANRDPAMEAILS